MMAGILLLLWCPFLWASDDNTAALRSIHRVPSLDVGAAAEPFPAPRVSASPHHGSTKIHEDMLARRNAMALHDLDTSLRSQSFWMRVHTSAECLGQICSVATPIVAAFSSAFSSTKLAIGATITGVFGVGFGRLSNYAYKEGMHRSSTANRILESEGVRVMVAESNPSDAV